jgi:hypothetical protein
VEVMGFLVLFFQAEVDHRISLQQEQAIVQKYQRKHEITRDFQQLY